MTRISRSRSLRLRLTALATLAITVTVALTAAVLVFTLVSAVRANVGTTLSAYADSIAQSGQSTPSGRWPAPLPESRGDVGVWAQVVDSSGHVLAATANVEGLPPLYTLPAGSTTPRPTAAASPNRGDERVVGQRYVVGTTPVVIYVGGSTELLGILTSDIQGHLLFALPLILFAAVAISWFLIGRTLRPVERIRAEAAEITGSDLHRRIPEPDSDDEIGRLARTLNTMLDRLESSATRQRRFVADASHELRTPLAAVRTTMEVGLAHPDKAPWPELAERTVTETTRLQRLVEALLLLARSDDDTLITRREPVDLAELTRAAIALAPARVPVELVVRQNARVTGDPDQLTRLIRNLLDNADRHAERRIVVTLASDGPTTAVITIADDGPGIPPADRDRVFDRFVRLQTSRTRHAGEATGTGLGLSIARDIAIAHGGALTVGDPTLPGVATSAQATGATFTILLPTRGADAPT
ncbi:signal transduction histidine kinase [Streptacidiphilus sp. MAP12-20]|uniref:sensor histidine kinase n=1 Tax=Streptacidiphilus sp. MAP12-20 TaxID=3156299 RepID=UPI0035162933